MTRRKEPPKDLLDWMRISNSPEWGVAQPLGPLFTVVLVVMFVLALAAAMVLLVSAIFGGEGSLGTGALIVALLSSPFLIWNTIIKQRALGFQKEGHLTDRLAKAVEQLGAEKTVKKIVEDKDGNKASQETTEPNLEVRMGGLLSLERIAQDSTAYDKGRDHVRVMEIICAYIRNNAPASSAMDFPLLEWTSLPDKLTGKDREDRKKAHFLRFGGRDDNGAYYRGNIRDWAQILKPRVDITLALRILGRRSARQRKIEASEGSGAQGEGDWVFDQPCQMFTAELGGYPVGSDQLIMFRFEFHRWKWKLRGYTGYRLDLSDCCLQGAMLKGLQLGGALLDGSRLEGADLRDTHLEGAGLWRASLKGANLRNAQLHGADLRAARLDAANLVLAQLVVADLRRADFIGADLWVISDDGSPFRRPASFWGAAVRAVDFRESDITQKQIDVTLGDCIETTTGGCFARLPDDIKRPRHWADWDLGWETFEKEWDRWLLEPNFYKPPVKVSK